MVTPSRYWTIWRFEAIEGGGIRTRGRKCDRAQAFFQQQFPQFASCLQLSSAEEREIQSSLLSTFRTEVSSPEDLNHQAIAGLCLRCYVSYDILRTCYQLVAKYSGREFNRDILLDDLLPLVLDDTGETLIVPEESPEKYRALSPKYLNPNYTKKREAIPKLPLKILGSYQGDRGAKSLTSWTQLLVRQNEEAEKVLLEHSIHIRTPWSLLKKVTSKQLENLSDGDRRIVEAFQAVYRRDILQNSCIGKSCPEPSEAQLVEISSRLKPQGIVRNSPRSLLEELKEIAEQLRQDEIWMRRKHPSDRQKVPLEIESDSGESIDYLSDPNSTIDAAQQEQKELLTFLFQQLASALTSGIERGIEDRTIELSQSKSYAPFASKFARCLRLLYVQNLPQKQIARELGISNQTKVSRIFSPKVLLLQVRFRTIEKLIENVLDKAQALGLTRLPPDPHYLSHVVRQLEDFVDAEIFDEAISEVMAGSHRSLDSIYARELRAYLSNWKST